MIHPTAQVDGRADLGERVKVGPYSVIGPEVQIGDDCELGPHVVIDGPTRIGEENRISQFCSLGGPPQDKKYAGERTFLEVGARNVIREFCTFNRGTAQGGGTTALGNDNWIMAYVHIAHDCAVGSGVILANGATLAGHVRIDDRATLGAFTVVHQFCAIGCHAFSAMGTVVFKDIPPYVTAAGNAAEPHGIDSEGLRRCGFSAESIRVLREAYKILYKRGLTVPVACEALEPLIGECPEVRALVDFIRSSSRGVIR